MQDMVGDDNNRTPAIFQVPDIYRFVGEITAFQGQDLCQKSSHLGLITPYYIQCLTYSRYRKKIFCIFLIR